MALTSGQMRAARGLAGWTQSDLARAAGVSVETIKKLEKMPDEVRANPATLAVIEQALDRFGILLIDENGEGPGVRLRKERG